MKKGKIISIVSGSVLLVALIIAIIFLFRDTYKYFYTQIDNTKYTITIDDDKNLYEYKLDSYNDKGSLKNISFKTTRELRGGAFLKLKYTNLGGVVTWEEVKWDELPEKLHSIYQKQE